MKKKILAGALVVLCLSLMAAGTAAYFTARDTAHNVITTGNVNIRVEELTDQKDAQGNPIPFEDPVGILPSAEVSKIVQVKNTGSADAWVRIRLVPGFRMSPKYAPADFQPDPDLLIQDLDLRHWKLKDGWYYYQGALGSGKTTEPLLKSVKFSPDIGNEYQECKFTLDVQAQAVQVKNNGTTVWEAKGWPADK